MSATTAFHYEKKALPGKVSSLGIGVLILGLALGVAAFAADPLRTQFVSIMLFMFMAGIGICALFMCAIEYVAGAVWSVPLRRIFELVASLVLPLPIFALPIIVSMGSIYEWMHVGNDPVLQAKAPYLNQPFFLVRFVLIMALWIAFYMMFTKNSFAQDESKDQNLTAKNIKLSAIFIPVFGLSITALSIDFLMSLEPHWFSTIFGVNFFAGSLVASLSVIAIITILLNENGYLAKGVKSDHLYSVGFGMFAGCVFWMYTAFSQGMLIWYANIPEETPWFLHRWQGGWKVITIGLIVVHFLIPLFGLIQRKNKRSSGRMLFMAVWILFAHMFDLYWIVMPAHNTAAVHAGLTNSYGPSIGLAELAAVLIAVGFTTFWFAFRAKDKNLMPIGDPKLMRGMNFRL